MWNQGYALVPFELIGVFSFLTWTTWISRELEDPGYSDVSMVKGYLVVRHTAAQRPPSPTTPLSTFAQPTPSSLSTDHTQTRATAHGKHRKG
jgi:hypothetical protein